MNTKKIKELNDAFRTGQRQDLGRIMITAGVRELANAWPLGVIGVIATVRAFSDFNADNNPHGENDFGSFELGDEKCFFKIDYYDKSMDAGSENPADEKQTTRVLTIMLASEY